MTDLVDRIKASHHAQELVQDLLRAGEDILKYGNLLHNDVHDRPAWEAAVRANTRISNALAEFYKVTQVYEND